MGQHGGVAQLVDQSDRIQAAAARGFESCRPHDKFYSTAVKFRPPYRRGINSIKNPGSGRGSSLLNKKPMKPKTKEIIAAMLVAVGLVLLSGLESIIDKLLTLL